jgi:hypothetical protein
MIMHDHKEQIMEIEKATPRQDDGINGVERNFTPEEEKAILRRVDQRLVGVTGVMYCISLMDRNNLGAAAIAGMNEDLDLVGYRYVSFTVMFYCSR